MSKKLICKSQLIIGLCVLGGAVLMAHRSWAMPTDTLPTGSNFGAQVASSTPKALVIFNGVTFASFAVAEVPHGLDGGSTDTSSTFDDASGPLFKTKGADN